MLDMRYCHCQARLRILRAAPVPRAVKDKFLPASRRDRMVILAWAFVHGLSGLLLEGPLGRMAGDDLKSNDEIESALRAFEFLISGRGKRRL